MFLTQKCAYASFSTGSGNPEREAALDAAWDKGKADKLAGRKFSPYINGQRLVGTERTLYGAGYRMN